MHRETLERTMANERHDHRASSDDITLSTDNEPVKWNAIANAIAAISESENRVGFNSSDVPKRGAIRCETAVSMGRMLRMLEGLVLH